MPNRFRIYHGVLLVLTLIVLLWSGIAPKDRATWVLETLPIFIAVLLMAVTFKKFSLTPVLYFCIAIHCVILAVGGRYTYAEVPVGDWVKDLLDLKRNHYDRLGHLAQGFVPALLAREIFVRKKIVHGDGWRFLFVVSVCLAFSAFYEMLEWWTALATGEGATAFLGTQGDIWDTQWDMFCALIGAISAQLILGKWQDQQIKKLSVFSKSDR